MKISSSSLLLSSLLLAAGLAVPALAGEPETPKPLVKEPATKEMAAKPVDSSKQLAEPYPLSTCPVLGGKLGGMGDPVIKLYDGREVRFCCGGCPPKFEKDLAKNLAKLDEAIIKDQIPLYPTDTSIVTGKKLPEKPIDWVFNNRLVRLADEAEKVDFKKDTAKYLATLDKAVADKQGKDYPLKTCAVSNEDLGSMGEAKDAIVGGRLVRLCCNSCKKEVRKDPAKFIAMIDDARKAVASGKAGPAGKQPAGK